jgi:hypothetical protein
MTELGGDRVVSIASAERAPHYSMARPPTPKAAASVRRHTVPRPSKTAPVLLG